MIDFFGQVIGFFEMLIGIVVNTFTMLFTLVNVLIGVVEVPIQLSIVAPGVLGAGITITVALGVAKFIVGR